MDSYAIAVIVGKWQNITEVCSPKTQ